LTRTHDKRPLAASAWIAGLVLLAIVGCSVKRAGPDVMAKVNGRNITRSEVEKYYETQPGAG